MKRRIIFLSVVVTVLFAWAAGMSTLAAPPRDATPAPTDISIGPANSTPTPAVKPLQPSDSNLGGTAAATAPAFELPPKLADLLKQYPDLQPFLDKIKDLAGVDLPFDDLYAKVIEIYKDKGASGVAVFLKDTGILDKLN